MKREELDTLRQSFNTPEQSSGLLVFDDLKKI